MNVRAIVNYPVDGAGVVTQESNFGRQMLVRIPNEPSNFNAYLDDNCIRLKLFKNISGGRQLDDST